MGKAKDFIFIKCLNSLFDIRLIFQMCQIPRLPLSSECRGSRTGTARELGCPTDQGWWHTGHTACPMKSACSPGRHVKTSNIGFFQATQTDTTSVWLEVTDGVKMLKHSFQTGVQGKVQPLFTALSFTAQPLRLASKLCTIITRRSVFSRGFYS